MRRRARILQVALPVVFCSGCATLERGTTDALAIVSDPPGATATSSDGPSCVTPCTLEVSRWAEPSVTVIKAGFTSQTVPVKTRISDNGAGYFMENVVTAGIGGGVDVATGATLEHSPNPVSVTLRPVLVPGGAKGKPSR